MEDILYDTSWTIHNIPQLPPSIAKLSLACDLTPHSREEHRSLLAWHAGSLLDSLSTDKPRYEREEEQETIGGLKECTWTPFTCGSATSPISAGAKRKRGEHRDEAKPERRHNHGLLISLIYERKTYKFVIYSSTRKRWTQRPPVETQILLSKSSPQALKSLLTFFSDKFSLRGIYPLRLPSILLQAPLEEYLDTLYTYLVHEGPHTPELGEATLLSAIGTIKLGISFSAPVAPSLKTLEVAIPPATVVALCQKVHQERNGHDTQVGSTPNTSSFMAWLANMILDRTGLSLPVPGSLQTNPQPITRGTATGSENTELSDTEERSGQDEAPQPQPQSQRQHQEHEGDREGDRQPEDPPMSIPMRIARISTASYALSTDSRLKFSFKAVECAGNADDLSNIVRCANRALLDCIVEEARRQVRDDEASWIE